MSMVIGNKRFQFFFNFVSVLNHLNMFNIHLLNLKVWWEETFQDQFISLFLCRRNVFAKQKKITFHTSDSEIFISKRKHNLQISLQSVQKKISQKPFIPPPSLMLSRNKVLWKVSASISKHITPQITSVSAFAITSIIWFLFNFQHFHRSQGFRKKEIKLSPEIWQKIPKINLRNFYFLLCLYEKFCNPVNAQPGI